MLGSLLLILLLRNRRLVIRLLLLLLGSRLLVVLLVVLVLSGSLSAVSGSGLDAHHRRSCARSRVCGECSPSNDAATSLSVAVGRLGLLVRLRNPSPYNRTRRPRETSGSYTPASTAPR